METKRKEEEWGEFQMITLKELINREYIGKNCVSFDYMLQVRRGHFRPLRCMFNRASVQGLTDDQEVDENTEPREVSEDEATRTWLLSVSIPRADHADSHNYYIGYTMPKSDLPLELICATGLAYLQREFQREVQYKSLADFEIGQLIAGM